MTRLIVLLLLFLSSLAIAAFEQSDLWLQKSHGNYKAKVYRVLGEAHADDYVQIDIYSTSVGGKQSLVKTVDLPTPGYKGYVHDIRFDPVDQGRVVITVEIEMKAMNGVVLSDVFILDSSGTFELIVEAEYVDLYKEL